MGLSEGTTEGKQHHHTKEVTYKGGGKWATQQPSLKAAAVVNGGCNTLSNHLRQLQNPSWKEPTG